MEQARDSWTEQRVSRWNDWEGKWQNEMDEGYGVLHLSITQPIAILVNVLELTLPFCLFTFTHWVFYIICSTPRGYSTHRSLSDFTFHWRVNRVIITLHQTLLSGDFALQLLFSFLLVSFFHRPACSRQFSHILMQLSVWILMQLIIRRIFWRKAPSSNPCMLPQKVC